jgi:hypothetical protein
MKQITNNIKLPELSEVKDYAVKVRKNAEDNATALIILLLAAIAIIGFISVLQSAKKIRELKKIRKACRNNCVTVDCSDCDE